MKPYGVKQILESKGIDEAIDVIAGFPVRPGMFDINGAIPLPDNGVNFTIHTHDGTSCELLLFHKGEDEPYAILPFPEEYKIGDVYSMIVLNLNIYDFEYAYRIDGPNDPDQGYLYDKRNILLDPYAKAVVGKPHWGEQKARTYHARVVRDNFDWGAAPQSSRELSDLVIYELHVRGFTRHESSGVEHKGTFAGLKEKIPYLKELGVNAVELMPIFEFDENMNCREVDGHKLLEYWGYNTVSFFAPKSSYAAADEYNHEGQELKELIKALHDAGIEVILDVVFNHTAEGNEKGPVFSFKGFDNKIYYMLTPDGNYYNFSGCGNTMNCNHPIVRQMILECLRYWTVSYRVDGFRFDLASILGRNVSGAPMSNPPLLEALAYDPILRNVKLIAEAWDAGGMYQVGNFPASRRWAEWNGRYRDVVRGYLKGDAWEAHPTCWSIAGSADMYGAEQHEIYVGYNSCVNFLTCHDGFTLYDLYSYNEKHNWNNGWNNTDGANDNRSWNCGIEGDTHNPEIIELRHRMMKNAFAVLMCSRGTPMFLAGDEFCNTQFGNNNSYCQDNEVSWLDWRLLEQNRDMFEFFKYMIQFRYDHPSIRKKMTSAVCGMEALRAYDITSATRDIAPDTRTFSMCFAGYDREKGEDDIVLLSMNTYWEDVTIQLPELGRSGVWYLCVNTYGDGHGNFTYPSGEEIRLDKEFVMKPRSVAVFIVKPY